MEEGAQLSGRGPSTRETTVKRSNRDVDSADRPSRRAKKGHTSNATAKGRPFSPTDGSENSNLTVVPATLWTDFAGSNEVCVLIGSMYNNPERLALY